MEAALEYFRTSSADAPARVMDKVHMQVRAAAHLPGQLSWCVRRGLIVGKHGQAPRGDDRGIALHRCCCARTRSSPGGRRCGRRRPRRSACCARCARTGPPSSWCGRPCPACMVAGPFCLVLVSHAPLHPCQLALPDMTGAAVLTRMQSGPAVVVLLINAAKPG